jgi:hypothetical protein
MRRFVICVLAIDSVKVSHDAKWGREYCNGGCLVSGLPSVVTNPL